MTPQLYVNYVSWSIVWLIIIMRKEKTLSKTFVIFSMYELSEQPAREKAEDKTDLNNQRENGVHMLRLTPSQYIIMQNKQLGNN